MPVLQAFVALLLLEALLGKCEDLPQEEDTEYDDQSIEDEALSHDQLHRLHQKFDSNSDGKVSLMEIMSFARDIGKSIASRDIHTIIEELDTNRDGKISLEEHINDIKSQDAGVADWTDKEEQLESQQRVFVETAKFEAADTNHDGVLEEGELPALFYPETNEAVLEVASTEAMRQKDKNGDGKLTPEEFWEAAEGEDDDVLSQEEKEDFRKLDTDGDGYLSKDEIRHWESGRYHTEQAMKNLFELSDKDNDMHLTAAELADAREQLAASDANYHLVEWSEHQEL